MNLPTRQNKNRNQALDAVASIAKTWSEWRLGERAAQTVATGTKKASKAATKARKRAGKSDSAIKAALKSTPVKIAGAAAVVGGVGAAVAKKLKGGGTAEPLYTPPPAPAPMKPPVEVGDIPSPPKTAVKVGDLGGDDDGATSQSPSPDEAAGGGDDVADAMDAHSDSNAVTETAVTAAAGADPVTEPAVSAAADPDELESAAAGDAHGDDAPTVPADDDKRS